MGRINKSQQYAILWLHKQNKSNEEISKELSLTEKQVASCIKKNIVVEKEHLVEDTKEKEQQQERKSKNSMDFMIRKTSSKENNSVAIMTKEASEINDSLKQKHRSSYSKSSPSIHKIS
jgi:hypothetical protein